MAWPGNRGLTYGLVVVVNEGQTHDAGDSPAVDGLCVWSHACFQADFKAAATALIFFLPRSAALGSASAVRSAASSSALTFAITVLALGAR